jgi:hypothetical protein
MISRTIVSGAALLLKTLVFRSFQISQLTSMVRNVIAFRFRVALQDIMVHKDLRGCQKSHRKDISTDLCKKDKSDDCKQQIQMLQTTPKFIVFA